MSIAEINHGEYTNRKTRRSQIGMKIGVISDTHIRRFAELPHNLIIALSKVDLIVHAGDIVALDVVKGLEGLAPVKGVYGNMDLPEIRTVFPQTELLDIEGKKIAIVHGSGGPWDLALRVGKLFTGVDAVIFGHSHRAFNKVVGQVLYFNPGRASDSYGLLEVDREIKATIYENYY
ncbi:MAG: metallophosphoesterase family protein [Dehalococcoidia bacterium]